MKKLFTLLILLGRVVMAQAQQVFVGGILVSAGESASQVKSGTAKLSSDGKTLATSVVFGDKTTAGIDGITTDADAEVIGIYDAQGRKLEEMQQGVNIIRMSDGTTRKVIKK